MGHVRIDKPDATLTVRPFGATDDGDVGATFVVEIADDAVNCSVTLTNAEWRAVVEYTFPGYRLVELDDTEPRYSTPNLPPARDEWRVGRDGAR